MQQKKPQKSRVKPAVASAANRRDSSPAVGFPNKIAQNQHPQALSDDFHYGHGHTGVQARMRPQDINVLIACEESQAECQAFRERGFNAYSCDIQPVRRGMNPCWHIHGDVTSLLAGETSFITQAGEVKSVHSWHLIIAHPPCTYLCKLSSVHMVQHGDLNQDRFRKMQDAAEFFRSCLNAKADFVAVENPIPMARAGLPRPDCFIQPSWFGVKYTKKTLYWLRGLPPLMPEIEYPNPREFVRASRGKYRSRTFPQVAEAIARQWGNFVLDEMNQQNRASVFP